MWMLVFTPLDSPETEICVITAKGKAAARSASEVDAMDARSIMFADASGGPGTGEDTASLSSLVTSFLERHAEQIHRELARER